MEIVIPSVLVSIIALGPMLICAFVAASWSLDRSRRGEAFMWGLLLGPLGILIVLYLFPNVTRGYTAEQRRDFQALVQSRGRIGAMVSDADGVTIVSVTPEGPAGPAGLQVGDRLVTIDGTLVTNDYKLNVMRATGEKGTTATLTVRRGDAIHTFTVERA